MASRRASENPDDMYSSPAESAREAISSVRTDEVETVVGSGAREREHRPQRDHGRVHARQRRRNEPVKVADAGNEVALDLDHGCLPGEPRAYGQYAP